MNLSLNRTISNLRLASPESILQVALTWLWVPAVFGFFITSYRGVPLTEALSFMVDDSWCLQQRDGIGDHCFGDFALPYYGGIRGVGGVIYDQANPAAAINPFGLFGIDMLTIFPFRLALSLYLLVALGAIVVVLIRSGRGIPFTNLSFITVFAGLLSVGTLAAIDRGNNVIFMAPLAILALTSKRTGIAVAAATAFIALKVWGICLLVALVAQRKYREALISTCAALLLNLALLPVYSRSLSDGLAAFGFWITNREYASEVSKYSVSISSLARKLSCFGGTSDWCPGQQATSQLPATLFSLLVLLILASVAYSAVRSFPTSVTLRFTPTIMLGFLAVPEAATYNLVLTSVIAAFILIDASSKVSLQGGERLLAALIGAAVAITSAPIPWWFSVNGEMVRLPYILAPVTWGAIAIAFVAVLLRHRHKVQRVAPGQH